MLFSKTTEAYKLSCEGSEKRRQERLETLSFGSEVFVRRASTGSEPFSFLICLDATKFVLPSVFTLKEAVCPNICLRTRLKRAKSPLPVDVRAQNVAAFLKDSLFSLPRRHS